MNEFPDEPVSAEVTELIERAHSVAEVRQAFQIRKIVQEEIAAVRKLA